MAKNTYTTLLVVSLLVILGACKKTPEEAETIHDTLREGKWRQVSGLVRFQGMNGVDSTSDYFSDLVPSCVKDDYIVFKANFDGVIEDADTTCGVGDPYELPFTWEVREGGTQLNIYNAIRNFRTASVHGKILNLSGGNLSLEYTVYEQFTPGDIDTLTYTNEYSK